MEMPSSLPSSFAKPVPDAPASAIWRGNRWAILSALLLFVASFVLDTRNNGFPLSYHPDESSKVKQLSAHKRNFNHPLLLLSGSEVLVQLRGRPRDPQEVVILGRTFV